MNRAFLAFVALVLSACSSPMNSTPKVSVAYDNGDLPRVEKAKSYHWSLPDKSTLNPYNNQDLYLSLVKSDIDAQMAAKGYKLVDNDGDLEVSFLALYKSGATTSVVDQYFGTNRAPEKKLIAAVNQAPELDYEVGALIVDAEDAKDHESLWRGVVVSPVDRSKPFEAQKKRINRAVSLVMVGFPTSK